MFLKVEFGRFKARVFEKDRVLRQSKCFAKGVALSYYKARVASKSSSLSSIKNSCILSGKSRAVFRLFRLSRMQFKLCVGRNLLYGVGKACW